MQNEMPECSSKVAFRKSQTFWCSQREMEVWKLEILSSCSMVFTGMPKFYWDAHGSVGPYGSNHFFWKCMQVPVKSKRPRWLGKKQNINPQLLRFLSSPSLPTSQTCTARFFICFYNMLFKKCFITLYHKMCNVNYIVSSTECHAFVSSNCAP